MKIVLGALLIIAIYAVIFIRKAQPKLMWWHGCDAEQCWMQVGKGESCSWCGEEELKQGEQA